MQIDEIIEYVEALGGVLTLKPQPGDGSPEISWGDVFFYYAPDGTLPKSLPFATIVTKDYPDDHTSRLNRPAMFRLNISTTPAEFLNQTGHTPRAPSPHPIDPSTPDALFPHPTYAAQSWLSVINPGPQTTPTVHTLLHNAHQSAQTRHTRRQTSKPT